MRRPLIGVELVWKNCPAKSVTGAYISCCCKEDQYLIFAAWKDSSSTHGVIASYSTSTYKAAGDLQQEYDGKNHPARSVAAVRLQLDHGIDLHSDVPHGAWCVVLGPGR